MKASEIFLPPLDVWVSPEEYAVSRFSRASFSALLGTTVPSTSPLYLAVTCSVFLFQSLEAFGRIPYIFYAPLVVQDKCAYSFVCTTLFWVCRFGTESGTNYWMECRSIGFGTESGMDDWKVQHLGAARVPLVGTKSGTDYWKVYSSCGTACRWLGTESGADYWKVHSWEGRHALNDGIARASDAFVDGKCGTLLIPLDLQISVSSQAVARVICFQLQVQVALCGFCLAEVMSTSAASQASCVPCTVSSGCRGPTVSRLCVST